MGLIQQPGISNPEDKFNPRDNLGALLLFFPTSFQEKVKTEHGEADAVAATVVRLNDGRVYENALIFPTALVTQLKGYVPDGITLGTLVQGENKKGNPPWLLRPFTAQEEAQAEAWIAANPRNPIAQPVQPQSQPAPAWGQAPPTQPAPAAAWGQTPPAPAPAAPATGGWGSPANPPPADVWGGVNAAPAAPAPASSPGAAWGSPPAAAAAPVPPVAPAPAPTVTSSVHPGLVEALRKKGVVVPPDATQEAAEQAWAVYQNQPDVA